jgi:hypothetical protein
MTKRNIDFTYKDETRELVARVFDSWQLVARDPREGFNSFLNRVVSFARDVTSESYHVENMFFPDRIDMDESWVLFKPYPATAADSVLVNGVPLSGTCTHAESIDDLVAGDPDYLVFTAGYDIPISTSIAAFSLDEIYCLSGQTVTRYNLLQLETEYQEILAVAPRYSGQVVFDRAHRLAVIRENIDPSTISVIDQNGYDIPVTIMTQDSVTGIWNSDYDADRDGVISTYEKNLVSRIVGTGASDYPPDRWEELRWADVDMDGVISRKDKAKISASIPSLAPDVVVALEASAGITGNMTLTASYDIDTPVFLSPGAPYTVFDTGSAHLDQFKKCVHDDETGIWYGLDHEGYHVYAYRLTSLDTVGGMTRIHCQMTGSEHAVDIALNNGTLYVLIYGAAYRVAYGYVRTENCESISGSLPVTLPEVITLIGINIFRDRTIGLYSESRLLVFTPERNKYYIVDDEVYTNRRYVFSTASGTLKTVPFYVFNTMDSFAYSFGMLRPLGCDNYHFRDLMFDFYRHPQSNTRTGMSYGISRNLGYVNTTITESGIFHDLMNRIDFNYPVYFNNEAQTVSSTSDSVYVSGSLGVARIVGDRYVVPSPEFEAAAGEVEVRAHCLDYDGNSNEMTSYMTTVSGTPVSAISVVSYGDSDALGDVFTGRAIEHHPDVIEKVSYYEATVAYRYDRAVTNMTPMDCERYPFTPIIPTRGSQVTSDSDTIEYINL